MARVACLLSFQNHRAWMLASCAVATLLFSGCRFLPRDAVVPMPSRFTPADASKRADTLVVFLPGRGGTMDDFTKNRFVAMLHETGVRADAVVTDAHLGYYLKRTVIDRLKADVLTPARQKGYSRIVAVGISLGGMGALLSERDQPGLFDELVLIAPYLGDRSALFSEIKAAGGPQAWASGRPLRDGEIDEQIWTFLGKHVHDLPPTWLLFGEQDRLAEGQRQLADLLPPDRVKRIEGGHDWRAWRTLWQDLCQNSDLFAAERATR
jgi:pimeloyl-ACP methyl ester carboxylesterase